MLYGMTQENEGVRGEGEGGGGRDRERGNVRERGIVKGRAR